MRRFAYSCLLLALLAPLQLQAQRRPRASPPVSAGARVGYEVSFDKFVAGGYLRIPLPGVSLELQGVADFTFLSGFTARQYAADLIWRTGAGIYLGGGPVFRNTLFSDARVGETLERETRRGYSLFFGFGGTGGGLGGLITGVELRWVFVDDFKPRTIMAQFGIPLLWP
jgi:hypothetical protein